MPLSPFSDKKGKGKKGQIFPFSLRPLKGKGKVRTLPVSLSLPKGKKVTFFPIFPFPNLRFSFAIWERETYPLKGVLFPFRFPPSREGSHGGWCCPVTLPFRERRVNEKLPKDKKRRKGIAIWRFKY